MDDNTVVSEIGEQWSPHTAPASTHAIAEYMMCIPVGSAIPCTTITAHASGMINGTRIAMVPQLVPVVKAVIAARMNAIAGISSTGNESASSVTRYGAVFSAAVTSDNDHANTRIIFPGQSLTTRRPGHRQTMNTSSLCKVPSSPEFASTFHLHRVRPDSLPTRRS